jgi:catechol 2,3-dioxygenase-like lactoylglutathione lyase family enzyme
MAISRDDLPAPTSGLVITHFLVARDPAVAADFYVRLLDGEVVLDVGPTIVKAANAWIIISTGGGPTPDKPDVVLDVPDPSSPVTQFLNVRVADLAECRRRWAERGIDVVAEPWDRGPELRAYVRDPDGHLIEVGEATGLLDRLAELSPPARPTGDPA